MRRPILLVFCLTSLVAPVVHGEKPRHSPPASVTGGTRTEHDLLGEKQIPGDAYYGVQTLRALENFRISNVKMNTYPEFVQAYALVKLAAARANTKVGAMKRERLGE